MSRSLIAPPLILVESLSFTHSLLTPLSPSHPLSLSHTLTLSHSLTLSLTLPLSLVDLSPQANSLSVSVSLSHTHTLCLSPSLRFLLCLTRFSRTRCLTHIVSRSRIAPLGHCFSHCFIQISLSVSPPLPPPSLPPSRPPLSLSRPPPQAESLSVRLTLPAPSHCLVVSLPHSLMSLSLVVSLIHFRSHSLSFSVTPERP